MNYLKVSYFSTAGRLRPQVLLKAEMEGEILIFFNSGQKKVDVIRSNVYSHFSLMQTFKLLKILLEAWSQNSLGCFRLVLDVNIIRGFIEIGAPENAWSFLHRYSLSLVFLHFCFIKLYNLTSFSSSFLHMKVEMGILIW